MNVAQEAITAILKPLVLIQKGVILVLVMLDLLEMEYVAEVGIFFSARATIWPEIMLSSYAVPPLGVTVVNVEKYILEMVSLAEVITKAAIKY